MSIVRIGLAETKKFSEGYDAIFGKKQTDKDAPKAAKEAWRAGAAKTKRTAKAGGRSTRAAAKGE